MPEVNGIRVPFIPAGGESQLKGVKNNKVSDGKFDQLFNQELNKLKFSSHASARLKSRDINLGTNEINRLQSAFESVKAKGAKESLILMDNNAFIVNVPNKTIITAIDSKGMESNVITNIDSAVIA